MKDKALNISLYAVFSISFIQSGINAISSALPMIIAAFPEYSATTVRFISTLPSLMSMFVGIILGATIGKKVRFKSVFLVGCVFYVIGGCAPAFFHESLPLILVFRAIYGLASGCFTTINAYILTTQEVSVQAKYIGLAAMIANIGAALIQLVTGPLADYYWPYAFLPSALGILSFVIVLIFMKDPGYVLRSEKKDDNSSAAEVFKNKALWVYAIIQLFVSMTATPVIIGMGTVVAGRNLAGDNTGTVVGVILSVCQVGGIITGAIFGRYVVIMKRYTMPVAMFIQGLGIFLILVAKNAVIVGLGATVSGIGTILIMSLCTTYIGQVVPKKNIPIATVLIMLISQIAMFFSSYFIAFCDVVAGHKYPTDVENEFFLASIAYVVAIILTLVFNVNPKKSVN